MLKTFFDTPSFSSLSPLYALIESVAREPRRAEALIKVVYIKPKTINHLVVSQGVAQQIDLDKL